MLQPTSKESSVSRIAPSSMVLRIDAVRASRAVRAISTLRHAVLVAIVVAGIAVAGDWACRVPFFQNPDEAAHADYAFALYDAGQIFHVDDAHPSTNVTPQTQFFARAANYRRMRYNVRGQLPDGYGSPSFFRSLDARAPHRTGAVPAAGSTVPYVMFSYPPLYYVAIAFLMTLATSLSGGSLVAAFFAARFFSVACLAVTILLAFEIFRLLRIRWETALLAVFALALLPFTSASAAAIQPDNLIAVLMNATLYLLLRFKRDTKTTWPAACTAVTMTALAFVKLHYALAIFVPAWLLLATARHDRAAPRSRRFAVMGCILLTPVALLAAPHMLPVTGMQFPRWTALEHAVPLAQRAFAFGLLVIGGLSDNYLGGNGMEGFWIRFGVRAGSVYSGTTKSFVLFLLAALTCMTALFFALRQWRVLRAIAVVARRRSGMSALRLLGSDVLSNTYLLTTALLLGIYALTDGELALQGRYWFPVLVPTLALSIVAVPRLLPRQLRQRASFFAALLWATYAGISCPLAIAAREQDYYGPHRGLPQNEIGEIQTVRDEHERRYPADVLVTAANALTLSGYALDAERGFPARSMTLRIDGKRTGVVRTGLRSEDVARTFNDPLLVQSGFRATFATSSLRCGSHRGAILVHESRAPQGLAIARFSLVIARPRCHAAVGRAS